MRPIVKQVTQETGCDCAQELPQQAAATAAGESDEQHHRVELRGEQSLGCSC
jgi:hypothetical protein